MPRDELKLKNSAGLILTVYLRSSTTGQGLTGKTHSDFAGQWNRGNTASSALSFAAGSVGDSHSSGKIAELGNGRYYWHVPDSLFTAVGQVVATLQIDGAIDVKIEWQVVEVDRESPAFAANTTTPLDATATQAAAAAAIAAANLAQPGDEMSLTSENLTALFADVDVAGLVASVTAAFDEATDLPVQTIAADAATRTVAALVANAQILALIADAAAAKTAALSVDAKLTSDRAAKLDRDLAHASDADTYKATVPTVEDIDTRLSTSHGAGSWIGGGGETASVDYSEIAAAVAVLLKTSVIRSAGGLTITDLSAVRGTTWALPIPITLPAGWTRIEFTARKESSDLQAESALHVAATNGGDAGDGLLLVTGLGSHLANGSIDTAAEVPLLRIAAVASTLLPVDQLCWDAKVWVGEKVSQEARGTLNVEPDVTRSVTA